MSNDNREEHDRKVKMLLQFAARHRISQDSVAPPVYRLLWKYGWLVRPPHFQPAWMIALWFAVWMFVGLGAAALLIDSTFVRYFPLGLFALCLLCGFGVGTWYRFQARRFNLGSWNDFKFKSVKHHHLR